MKVQLTWNDPASEAKVEAAVPSLETDRSGGAALESASSWMTFAASSPAWELTSTVALSPFWASEISCPPAPAIRALIQTTYPSYLLAWTPILPPLSEAALMIWSQVTGCDMSRPAFWTNDLRYHSTCVFDQNGKTTT